MKLDPVAEAAEAAANAAAAAARKEMLSTIERSKEEILVGRCRLTLSNPR